MKTLTVELKDLPDRIDEIIESLQSGVQVFIHRNGTTQKEYLLSLTEKPAMATQTNRTLGLKLGGEAWIADDFNAPLPDAYWDSGSCDT